MASSALGSQPPSPGAGKLDEEQREGALTPLQEPGKRSVSLTLGGKSHNDSKADQRLMTIAGHFLCFISFNLHSNPPGRWDWIGTKPAKGA